MTTMVVEVRGEGCNFGVKLRSTCAEVKARGEVHGLSELPSNANKGWAKVALEVVERGEGCSVDISMHMLQAKVRRRWQLRSRQEERDATFTLACILAKVRPSWQKEWCNIGAVSHST